MALSASTNFVVTRDDIITRALRLIGAIGQGESGEPLAVTEAAQVLNMIVKERAADGMQLWRIITSTFTMVAGTATYNIGTGSTIAQAAPLKIIQAWRRNTTTLTDSPVNIITKQEYDRLGNKVSQGAPNQMFYKVPGPNVPELIGNIALYPAPNTATASSEIFVFTGVYPLQDFDTSTDNPDFPSYYFNALTWLLADELAFEYGVPLAERGMIAKKAQEHLQMALDNDIEEGSYFIQPQTDWGY